MRFPNGCNKVVIVIKLRARSILKIIPLISDQIVLHSVQLVWVTREIWE